ncbi:MAG: hypothetical protein K2O18_00915 [Oscillospiraceae bacterium]|nr:hypothetical protein [Oscillospiraceae bacterium]
MNYADLKQTFQELKKTFPKEDLTAHIIFTADSFAEPYSLLSRTYSFNSNNNGFWPDKFSRSIFAYCLDGTDQGVRLDWYMLEEGNKDGWNVQDCYILEQMQDADAISGLTQMEQDDGSICYFFGNTCIQARESRENGKIRLEPLTGKQASDSKWAELAIDRIYGYCSLLERQLNKEGYHAG